MQQCWEYLNADLNHWAPWVRFFGTSDDKHFIIDADLDPPPAWVTTVIRRKTAVFWCSENAGVTDLNADFEFPPETTAEQAIAQMGYELVEPREYAPPEPESLVFAEGSTGPEGSTGATA